MLVLYKIILFSFLVIYKGKVLLNLKKENTGRQITSEISRQSLVKWQFLKESEMSCNWKKKI